MKIFSPSREWLTKLPRSRSALAFLLVLLGGSGFLLLEQRSRIGSSDISESILAKTAVATENDLEITTPATGVVHAERRVNLSPVSSGKIEALYITEGQFVSQGQLIARMDNEQAYARLRQVQAQISAGEAELNAAKKKRQRYEKLLSSGAITQDILEELVRDESQAKSRLQEAHYRLAEVQSQLSETEVRAPFSGIITRQYAYSGQFVTPTTSASTQDGASSTSIAELSSGIIVIARLAESDLANVYVGQQAAVTTDAFPGITFPAIVESISPRAVLEEEVISFPVRVKVTDKVAKLKPAMSVRIDFLSPTISNAITIPQSALIRKKDGQTGVILYDGKSSLQFIAVTAGEISGNQVQIVEGLKPGQRVLTSIPPNVSIAGYP